MSFVAEMKVLLRRMAGWIRRRRNVASRLSYLEREVDQLRQRIEITSAFYERRIDQILRAIPEQTAGKERYPDSDKRSGR